MADGIIEVKSEAEFTEQVEQSPLPVVVDFWAPWCGPCQMQRKVLEEFAGKSADKVRVVKVNVDEVQALAQRYMVQSIPTLLFFKNGQLESQKIGLMRLEELEAKF